MGKKILATSLVWFLLILMAASPGGADDIEGGQENGGEVVLNPGYIQGTVSLGDTSQNTVEVDHVEIYANSYDSDGKKLHSEMEMEDTGEYHLVVHVPDEIIEQGGTQEYTVSCKVYYSSHDQYFYFRSHTVNVPFKQPAQTVNFAVNPGFISGTVRTDSCDIREGWIKARVGNSSDANYVYTRIEFGENGRFHFPVQPGQDIKVEGECTLTNDWTHELTETTINVGQGQAVDPGWEVDCEDVCAGALTGFAQLKCLGNNTIDRIYIDLEGSSDKDIRPEADGTYRAETLQPGNYSIEMRAYLNNWDDRFYFHSYQRQFEIFCGNNNKSIVNEAAFLNGALSFGASTVANFGNNQDASLLSPTSGRICASGILEEGKTSPEYKSGYSRDYINCDNGEFDLIVSEGDWRIGYIEIEFCHEALKPLCGNQRYIDSEMRLYDYSQSQHYAPTTLSPGQNLNGYDFELESGAATFKFYINGDEVMESPALNALCYKRDDDGQLKKKIYLDAAGITNDAGTEGQATLIGPPGTYTVEATAIVNGTETTFGEKSIQIVAGTCQTFEFGAPELHIDTPESGAHVCCGQLKITGKATDSKGISQIYVNDERIAFQSAGNPQDPNEVKFHATLTIFEGQNCVKTEVVNTQGKSFIDNRLVYGYRAGVFTVDETGIVKVDYLYDGGAYEGELGIFSLSHMEELEPGSNEFLVEAARRAISNQDGLGHIVLKDADEGARFNEVLGARFEGQKGHYNEGSYLGVKTFNMNPGDSIAAVLIPGDEFQAFLQAPSTSNSRIRPIFSLADSNPKNNLHYGQIAGIPAEGMEADLVNAFVFEDMPANESDKDYNDVVVQIKGVTVCSPTLDGLIAEGMMPAESDWRNIDNPLMPHLAVPEPDPETPWMTITLKSPADLLVYDPEGRVIGKDGGEIPGASFKWDKNGHQVVTLPALDAGEYTIVLRAIGDGGLCHLEVQGYEGDTMVMSQETPLTIRPHEVLKTTVDAASFVDYGEIYFDPPQMSQADGRTLRFDYDGDGNIDEDDIAHVSERWGVCEGDAQYDPFYDLDENGCIDFYDVTAVANAYYIGQ